MIGSDALRWMCWRPSSAAERKVEVSWRRSAASQSDPLQPGTDRSTQPPTTHLRWQRRNTIGCCRRIILIAAMYAGKQSCRLVATIKTAFGSGTACRWFPSSGGVSRNNLDGENESWYDVLCFVTMAIQINLGDWRRLAYRRMLLSTKKYLKKQVLAMRYGIV